MKILCLQLARLGDILISAPSLHALKREHPDSHIDILVRPRFEDAAKLFSWMNVKSFPTEKILEPLLNKGDVTLALQELSFIVDDLKSQKYDLILNFTFSPFSSFLTKMISENSTSQGYTRYSDNTFAIGDFISGYFYSQVGIGRPNRLHISDLLAGMAGVTLAQQDWEQFPRGKHPADVAFHVGASQASKTISLDKMISIVAALQERGLTKIKLIGSSSEQGIANQIAARVPKSVENLCGRTTISELRDVISRAAIVIGADSAPMHFATLTGTPCLNLSFPTVNFFETGPRSIGSKILFADSDAQLLSHIVANEAIAIINAQQLSLQKTNLQKSSMCVAESISPLDPYVAPRWNRMSTEWSMIQSAYFRIPFDANLSALEVDGIQNFKQLNQLILEQYRQVQVENKNLKGYDFVKQSELLLLSVTNKIPQLGVLLRWLQASKTTVGPGAHGEILQQYINIHKDLGHILDELVPTEENTEENFDGNTNLSSK